MADKSLVTQVQLGELKSALAQEADSLIYHSGASMSEAHGFGIVMNGPANDGNNNDLTQYRDSNGDVVGTHMLQVCISGQNLWIPIKATALSGQSPLTGLQPNLSPLLQPGGNYWVTDFSTAGIADAQLVLSALLLPHTRRGYWEVHGGINAYAQTTYDSAAHTVGDYVVEIFFNSKKIWIPASTRLGGPIQTPRMSVLWPTFIYNGDYGGSNIEQCPGYIHFESKAGGGPNGDIQVTWTGIQGTFPITYQIQMSTTSTGPWTDMVNGGTYNGNGGTGLTCSSATYPSTTNPQGTTTNGTIVWSAHPNTPGGDDGGDLYIRLKLTNSAGTIYSCPFRWYIQDNAPCCWFCTEANKHNRLTEREWKEIGRVEQAVYKLDRRALTSYVKHGDKLVERMLAHGVGPEHFIEFTRRILEFAREAHYEEAARFYVQFVADDINAHWPEVKLRGWLRYLKVPLTS